MSCLQKRAGELPAGVGGPQGWRVKGCKPQYDHVSREQSLCEAEHRANAFHAEGWTDFHWHPRDVSGAGGHPTSLFLLRLPMRFPQQKGCFTALRRQWEEPGSSAWRGEKSICCAFPPLRPLPGTELLGLSFYRSRQWGDQRALCNLSWIHRLCLASRAAQHSLIARGGSGGAPASLSVSRAAHGARCPRCVRSPAPWGAWRCAGAGLACLAAEMRGRAVLPNRSPNPPEEP